MEKHATIPIFVPHLACPNQCIFCNQKKISGAEEAPVDISDFLENAISGLKNRFSEVDIAFFGGSFTGIERPRMISYLSQALFFKKKYPQISGIRLSTRPDYISKEILEILKSYEVTAIELGCQSFDDGVLEKSRRGHSAKETVLAASLIKSQGFELVLQLMPGMLGDTEETIEKTFEVALGIKPDGVRIYPCVVISQTPLEKLFYEGKFSPLSVDEAVKISAKFIPLFEEAGIKIIKVGLHSSDLDKNGGVIAGPYHPAFGELVAGEIYFNKIIKILEITPNAFRTEGKILVSEGEISKAVGNGRKNIKRLSEITGINFSVKEDLSLKRGEIKIEI